MTSFPSGPVWPRAVTELCSEPYSSGSLTCGMPAITVAPARDGHRFPKRERPMAADALEQRFAAAQAAARAAGRLALEFLADPDRLGMEMKGPQDFVTAADRAVERLIIERLAAAFPGD